MCKLRAQRSTAPGAMQCLKNVNSREHTAVGICGVGHCTAPGTGTGKHESRAGSVYQQLGTKTAPVQKASSERIHKKKEDWCAPDTPTGSARGAAQMIICNVLVSA
eukprot:1159129-Pelagomonas_calceolata.AAC.7